MNTVAMRKMYHVLCGECLDLRTGRLPRPGAGGLRRHVGPTQPRPCPVCRVTTCCISRENGRSCRTHARRLAAAAAESSAGCRP